jgi:hypothetical protein
VPELAQKYKQQTYGAGHLVTTTFGQWPIWPGQDFFLLYYKLQPRWFSSTICCQTNISHGLALPTAFFHLNLM